MTPRTFYRHLRRVAAGDVWMVTAGRIRRERDCVCPVAAVWEDIVSKGGQMVLSSNDSIRLVGAADDDSCSGLLPLNRNTRAALLRAVGLEDVDG